MQAAHEKVLAGQLARAEELYLGLLAIGYQRDPGLRRFFRDRYGKSMDDVMNNLLMAMGQTVKRRRAGDMERMARFPKRGDTSAKSRNKDNRRRIPARSVSKKKMTPEAPRTPLPRQNDAPDLADEEMLSLEEESLEESQQ